MRLLDGLAAYCKPMVIPAIARCAKRAVDTDWLLGSCAANSSKHQAVPSVAKGKIKPGASKADVALGYIGGYAISGR